MSLQLYIGHSGHTLQIDTTRISNLEALRTFIYQNASIQPTRQVLLTSKGKAVRAQSLLTELELFVFDSSLLSSSASTANLASSTTRRNATTILQPPTTPDVSDPPDTIVSQTDLQSWQALFHARQSWAQRLRERCATQADFAQRASDEQANIQRGLSVALESLQIHVRGAEQKQRAAAQWATELLRDQETRMRSWERDSAALADVPARRDFARFVQYGDKKQKVEAKPTGQGTLRDFMPIARVEEAAAKAEASTAGFKSKVGDIKTTLVEAKDAAEALLATADNMQSGNSSMEASMEPTKLMEEIDIILRKITSDDNYVGTLPRTTQSVSQASKMALLHTRNYLPNMREYTLEMDDLVRKAVRQRNASAEACMQHMQTLSGIESLLARVYADVKGLPLPQEDQQAFNTLNIVLRLPYVYGSLLIEAVRRREWIDKMKKDSSTLAEEMATYQEEEERRRKRWLNSIDDVIEPELAKSNALGIEVNLQAETDVWPAVDKEEVQAYIALLTRLQYPDDVLLDLGQAARAIDQPTRKQVKHAKAFRNGSMHEAAFGSASLMMRGEDDAKVLREANAKLEEDLRSHKSRVRKLEDLLHRQSTTSRNVPGDVFTPHIDLVSTSDSPSLARRLSEDYRPGSSRSRRTSSNHGQEEKKLARRIVLLEAELQSHREHSGALERDAQARQEAHEDGQAQIEEAIAIKKDIMHNMESQQREFALERRNLEDDLSQARARAEEMEDELDRILGSRDKDRSEVKALTTVARDAQHDAEDTTRKLKEQDGELEMLRHNLTTAEERNRLLQEQVRGSVARQQQAEASVRNLQAAAEEQRQVDQDVLSALINVHGHLAPTIQVPDRFMNIVTALEELAARSAAHERDLAEAIAVARAENESLLAQHQAQTATLADVRRQKAIAEDEARRMREQADVEAAKAASLVVQLDDERDQLKALRGKFAEGETGAGVLRQQVEQHESQVRRISEQLAEARSNASCLEAELVRARTRVDDAQASASKANSRLETRSARAKELSQRLFAQNARLLRLLEGLGFAVSHRDGQMVIERASKVGASTTLTDASQLLQRTVSLTSPAASRKASALAIPTQATVKGEDESLDLSFLHWAVASSPTTEDTLYTNLVQQLNLFSIDTFAEALSKRLRDFEYTARKFRLEARHAGVRANKVQSEAQAKLAVRDFKEGDLALFLPTKGKNVGAWAAFNINAPHHFLRERDGMNLKHREWLVARITRVEERVVDLGRSLRSTGVEADNISSRSIHIDESGKPVDLDSRQVDEQRQQQRDSLLEEENPFDLSDGLTWYLVHATEERSGAPTTPGLGKSTVQGSMDIARAERRLSSIGKQPAAVAEPPLVDGTAAAAMNGGHETSAIPINATAQRGPDADDDRDRGVEQLKAQLGKSLGSRRSSSTSKRSFSSATKAAGVKGMPIPSAAAISSPRLDSGRSPPDGSSEGYFARSLGRSPLQGLGILGGGAVRRAPAVTGEISRGDEAREQEQARRPFARPTSISSLRPPSSLSSRAAPSKAAAVTSTSPPPASSSTAAQDMDFRRRSITQPFPLDEAMLSSALAGDLRQSSLPDTAAASGSALTSAIASAHVAPADSRLETPPQRPSAGVLGGTSAAGESLSMRALRQNLQPHHPEGSSSGGGSGRPSPVKGGANQRSNRTSPTKSSPAKSSPVKRDRGAAGAGANDGGNGGEGKSGWRSLWAVDYEMGGGGGR